MNISSLGQPKNTLGFDETVKRCNELTPSGSINKIKNPQLQFQKNYPKNVFIPLIQFLAQAGYKQAYEQCVGTREQIQRKNVVSLDLIFNLTRQPWFERNINKNLLLVNISNKILMNSKIKKKLFHLLIAQIILSDTQTYDVRIFKKKISKEANLLSQANLDSDQLFSYSNSIIYLLTIFMKILKQTIDSKGLDKLNEQLDNLKIEQDQQEVTLTTHPKNKAIGSKQQYKFLVKEIVHIFGKKNLSISEWTDAYEEIKNAIRIRCNQIREKYGLIENIPNWNDFIQIVLTRCFESRRKDIKITNMVFNEWVGEYKSKSLNHPVQIFDAQFAGKLKEPYSQSQQEQSINVNLIKNTTVNFFPQSNDNECEDQTKNEVVRKFSPIILSKNYQ